ncbi:hypothetical protein [Bacteroides sp. 51]|uniref:hypothetical protein n=1 Tax=Bacteroides sp. 51 TaxID=2302938 RepID=UPI0013D4C800|nr:hypothetical protein [Bacteroides sp. 51]NDV83970.1 hypothetical protein [Bacteroides sp. 51]
MAQNVVFKHINKIYSFFLSDSRKKEVEKIIFLTAIVAFILHLTLIALVDIGIIPINEADNKNSLKLLSAIYTPFTIILLYEIYSLIYYLPKSLTIYLGKQYEIIVLILIRKIFYDLSNASVTHAPFEFSQIQGILITFTSLIVFCLLIFCFYKLSGNRCILGDERQCDGDRSIKYVIAKKILAIGLMLLFIVLFIWSFTVFGHISPTIDNTILILKHMNNTFFDIFFTALILTEVLVLLLSFSLTEQFHKIIRNSGFIISTILLKLSFKADGLSNTVIVFGAIAFGVAILGVYRLYERKLFNKKGA